MKMLYVQIGQEMFGLPPITEKAGRRFWWALGPIYWIVAFVVAMSVPQFTTFTNLIGAIFGNNFTYTLPSLMYLALKIHEGAKLPGEGFDPATGITTRHDFGPRRYIRGFLKNWTITVPTLLLGLGGLAASGMGTWAAILGLESAFGAGGSVLTSWTCVNPFYTKS